MSILILCVLFTTMEVSNVRSLLAVILMYYVTVRVTVNASKYTRNVCTDWKYYYGDRRQHCYTNPTAYYEAPDIIKYYGYPVEEHSVTTEDGYVLKIFRIPNEGKPPVLMAHGLGRNCAIYIDGGNDSLAYQLWNNGYDVWLENFRSAMYSSHVHLNISQKEYWQFSLHEIGTYDTSATVGLVYEKTRMKMFYVGHSMGTTAYFIFSSQYAELAKDRIRAGILMAPIAYFDHATTPLTIFLKGGFYQILKFVLDYIVPDALNVRTPDFLKSRQENCLPYPYQMEICRIPSYLLGGFDGQQENPETLPVFVMQDIDAIAIKTVKHNIQIYRTKKFANFDYGETKNKEIYGASKPPGYNLSSIEVPTLFIRGDGDLVATEKNVEKTMSHMRPSAKIEVHTVPYEGFTHEDFLTAKDVKALVYDYVLEFLRSNGSDYL